MSDITLINISNTRILAPRGMGLIIAVLERAGFKVDFRDYALSGLENLSDPDTAFNFIDRNAADIIGIGAMSSFLPQAVLVIKRIKEKYPDKRVILGGPGSTEVADELLSHFPFIDIIIRGESEETFPELLRALKSNEDLSSIKGISYNKGGQSFSNPDRPRIVDLDSLPWPAYDKIQLDKYVEGTGLELGRGCVYRCTFCTTSKIWGQQHRQRSVESVIDELKFVYETYGQKAFWFLDDTFLIDRKRAENFCLQLKDEHLDVQWSCSVRANMMDKDITNRLLEANCKGLFFGVESASDRILEIVQKGFTFDLARKVIGKCQKQFSTVAAMIYGFPFETMAEFQKGMMAYLMFHKMGCRNQWYLLTPYSLSDIYRQYKDTIRFSPKIFPKHGGQSFHHLTPETLDIIKTHPTIFTAFYHYSTDTIEKKHIIATNLKRQVYEEKIGI